MGVTCIERVINRSNIEQAHYISTCVPFERIIIAMCVKYRNTQNILNISVVFVLKKMLK